MNVRRPAAVAALPLCVVLAGCQVGMPQRPVTPLADPPPPPGRDIGFRVQDRWNDHGLRIVAGQRYRFSVTEVKDWRDDSIAATPAKGWTARTVSSVLLGPLSFLRACPAQPWYALVGVVVDSDGTEHCFAIGDGLADWTAPVGGRLLVIANDYPSDFSYRNNHGTATVRVMRLDQPATPAAPGLPPRW